MPDVISLPLPSCSEPLSLGDAQARLAKAVIDIHKILSLIVEHANEFIPSEAVDDLRAAWNDSKESFETEVALDSFPPECTNLELATLSRLKDSFLSFFYSHPLTDEKRARAFDAASNFLEFGATIVNSRTQIPQSYNRLEGFLPLVKQLISVRAKRGV